MGSKVRDIHKDGKLVGWTIYCPACGNQHFFEIGPRHDANGVYLGPGWTFDSNYDSPTLHPSMNVSWEMPNGKRTQRCHSVITAGRVSYCLDSTHKLSGQTVDLEDFPQ